MAKWNVGIETLSRIRRTRTGGDAGWGADGRPVADTEVTTSFTATRDPVPDKELATLPEGERQSGQLWLITETELRTADDNTSPTTLADHVVIDGMRYEVRAVVYYPQLIPHYEARVARIKLASP